MRLKDLKESIKDKKDWGKLLGNDDPINSLYYQKEKESKRSKRVKLDEFWLRIDTEYGGGYYKVRAKRTIDKGMLYNYGYFDMREIEDPNIDPNILTDSGKEDYRRLKNFIREHTYKSNPEGRDEADKRHKEQEKSLGVDKKDTESEKINKDTIQRSKYFK